MSQTRDRRQPGRTTLADVARASGFSVSAVSHVLNQTALSRNMAAQTRERIQQAAQQLDYRPDAFARSLRKQHSHMVGLMVFDIADPYCTLILQGCGDALTSAGYLPIIMDAQNEAARFQGYLATLVENRVAALVVVANWLLIDIELVRELRQRNLPTVIVGVELKSGHVQSVLIDNERGGYLALEHLYRQGHRRIAFIRGPQQIWDSSRRWRGMQRFAEEAGLKLHRKWIVELANLKDASSSFEEANQLTRQLLAADPSFTAIVAFDDQTAFGAIRALSLAGRSVPADCSVIGFDDVPYAGLFHPALTTVRQPMREMGQIAAEKILRSLGGKAEETAGENSVLLLQPTVVVRESTRPLSSAAAVRKPARKRSGAAPVA